MQFYQSLRMQSRYILLPLIAVIVIIYYWMYLKHNSCLQELTVINQIVKHNVIQPIGVAQNGTKRYVPEVFSAYQYLTQLECPTTQQSNKNGYMLYKCSKYCKRFGPGMVDEIKGAAMAYLISVALDKPFAMDLQLPCNAFEDVFEENCVAWKQTRAESTNITDWETVVTFATSNGKNFLSILQTSDLRNITGKGDVKNIEIAGNARQLDILTQNPHYEAKLKRFLNFRKTDSVTFQSVAEVILSRLFKISPRYSNFISNQLAIRRGEGTHGLICGHFRMSERNKNEKSEFRPLCNSTCVDRALKHMQDRAALYDKATYFIASDTSQVLRRFTELCPDCDVMLMPGSHGHTGRGGKNDCEAEIKAVWDLAFLMQCDTLLLSRNSFFGKITHYMRRNKTQDVCFINAKPDGKACYTDPEFLSNSD